jgi:hypothetical protein
MLTFTAKERIGDHDYTITGYMDENGVMSSFECREMDYLRGKTLAEIIKAIKKKEHDDKRGFKNSTAYMLHNEYYGEKEQVVEVTVTSLRDSKTVWVSYGGKKGGHGTETLDRLFADKAALEAALALKKKNLAEIVAVMKAVPRWAPIENEEKA